jgi:hypothetical protein
MTLHEQAALWREAFGWDEEDQQIASGIPVVLCAPGTAWTFCGVDFETLTVTTSLDASASGHWHGFIAGGQIVGGEILKL